MKTMEINLINNGSSVSSDVQFMHLLHRQTCDQPACDVQARFQIQRYRLQVVYTGIPV